MDDTEVGGSLEEVFSWVGEAVCLGFSWVCLVFLGFYRVSKFCFLGFSWFCRVFVGSG